MVGRGAEPLPCGRSSDRIHTVIILANDGVCDSGRILASLSFLLQFSFLFPLHYLSLDTILVSVMCLWQKKREAHT